MNYLRLTRGRSIRQFFFDSILGVHDTPHGIALGCALGLFVGISPAYGLHTILVLALAPLLGANIPAALACMWINNPLTFIPISTMAYGIGAFLMGSKAHPIEPLIRQAIHATGGWDGVMSTYWGILSDVIVEMLLGSLVLGLFGAALGYLLMKRGIIYYRRRKYGPGGPAATVQPDQRVGKTS